MTKTVEVFPYGILTTHIGKKFYLLASGASEPEDWMHEQQQKFLVVPFNNPRTYSKQYIITTDPDIEFYGQVRFPSSIEILEADKDA